MMTHEPLLLRAKTARDLFPVTEKVASAISRMPDDEKKWPAHIFSELLRELPFLAQYDMEIVLDRADPEAGAALGYAQVRNRTMSRPQDNISTPGNIIRIPIVVQDRRLQKFYIFEAGRQTYPMTEERVQQAMLNPAVFDTDATRVPASASLIDQLYPPYQQRQGFGRVTEPAAMGLNKLSSAVQLPSWFKGSDQEREQTLHSLHEGSISVRDLEGSRHDGRVKTASAPEAGHEKLAVRLGLACSPTMYRQFGHEWLETFENTPFYKEALAIQEEDSRRTADDARQRASEQGTWAKEAELDASVATLEGDLAKWKYDNLGQSYSATMRKVASVRDTGTWADCFRDSPLYGRALGIEKQAADNRVDRTKRSATMLERDREREATNVKAAELDAKLAGWRMEQAGVNVKTASAVVKLAFIHGARHPAPSYLASGALPYDQRQQAMIRYGREKANEEPTKRWKAMLTGMGIGGGTGALAGAAAGARHGSPGTGALMGGAAGAAIGALGGHNAQSSDAREIRRWKDAKGKGEDAEKGLADKRIQTAVEHESRLDREHKRNMEMALLAAATRPHETHHHHYTGGTGTESAKPEKHRCGHCGTETSSSTGNCPSCGAPMSRGTKVASIWGMFEARG